MLEATLLESSPAQRRRRSYATLLSFTLQAIAAGSLVLAPLIATEAVPALRTMAVIGPPAAAPAPAPAQQRQVRPPQPSQTSSSAHFAPRFIPVGVPRIIDREPLPPDPTIECRGCVIGSPGPSEPSGVPNSLFTAAMPAAVPAPAPATRSVLRVSQIQLGALVYQVRPLYPPLAVQGHIQGSVVLEAVIGTKGDIEKLRVVSGHPLLVRAAAEAVQQWRYRPYVLNGQAVEVESQITVNFRLPE